MFLGFIVNRVLIPQQNAALQLLDDGIASAEEIDLACEKALGLPLGPFKLLDHIGLDTAKSIRDGSFLLRASAFLPLFQALLSTIPNSM